MAEHAYALTCRWTGDKGEGTGGYRAYGRDHLITVAGKPPISGSADPAFLGDPSKLNPEELLLASVSACHMLWYLHLCADAGLVLRSYEDSAEARMAEKKGEGGAFTGALLQPRCRFEPGADKALARGLHEEAHARCFIARSVNFPIHVEPVIDG